MHRSLAGRISKSAHAHALVTFYRLAPEDPFPSGLMFCVEAHERLLGDGVPASRIIVGGDPAGGILTLMNGGQKVTHFLTQRIENFSDTPTKSGKRLTTELQRPSRK